MLFEINSMCYHTFLLNVEFEFFDFCVIFDFKRDV